MVVRIDPRSPGKSSDSDAFKDPHGHDIGSPSMGGHVGMGRDEGGSFSNRSMPRGGESPDGDHYREKYRPRGGGGGSSDDIPAGSELNDEGTGYAPEDDRDYSDVTVNRNVTSSDR